MIGLAVVALDTTGYHYAVAGTSARSAADGRPASCLHGSSGRARPQEVQQ